MRITFCGAVSEVTGSNFLVENERSKILIDCGIEQGSDVATERAYAPFPYDPKTIDALVVTHAHLDHVGRIPRLVKEGFRKPIYMTPPTRDIAELILRDSVAILGEAAKRFHREPLYVEDDLDAALRLMQTIDYHVETEVAPGLSVYLRNTGHILGSASVRVKSDTGEAIALTGDIGNSPSPLLPDWEPVTDADALVMESVYGNRVHPEHEGRVDQLKKILNDAVARGGAVLIPAFSIERTQLMLYEISNFFAEGSLPKVPVYLDSPLAIKVTELYDRWGSTYFKPEVESEMKREGSLFSFPFLTKTLDHRESEQIAKAPNPKIIIAGAGMSHGGRIGRWEAMYLPDPTTTLLIVGYQAPNSPGRRMAEGAKSVRIGDQGVEIRAHVEMIEGWSAHADRNELLDFAEKSGCKNIFVALGEPAAERFLAQRIHDNLGVRAIVPNTGDQWEVTKTSIRKV